MFCGRGRQRATRVGSDATKVGFRGWSLLQQLGRHSAVLTFQRGPTGGSALLDEKRRRNGELVSRSEIADRRKPCNSGVTRDTSSTLHSLVHERHEQGVGKMRRFTVWALVLLMLGCSDDPPVSPGEGTQLVSVRVQPNSTSELAVAVEVVVDQADSARVLFVERGGTVDSTPFVPLAQRQARIPVLGLRSEGRYRGVVELAGAEGTIQSDSVDFEGGDLPELLQRVSITTTGRGSPGWTLTALPIDERALVAFAFDSAGTIRWYREFADPGAGGELKQQARGNYTIYIGASFGSQPVPGRYVEFTPEGDSIRSFDAPEPLYTDNHELVITGSGASERAHLFGYDHRTTDLTFLGGPPDAQLAGHRVLRLRPRQRGGPPGQPAAGAAHAAAGPGRPHAPACGPPRGPGGGGAARGRDRRRIAFEIKPIGVLSVALRLSQEVR